MKFKKENNSATINTEQVIVGETTKKVKKHKINIKVIAPLALLIIFAISTLIVFVFKDQLIGPKDKNDEYLESISQLEDINEVVRKKVATPPTDTSTAEEKTTYFVNMLWLKVSESTEQELATYYINEVKPANITLPTDIKESLIKPLVNNGYKAEAKQLLNELLTSYSANSQSNDPAVSYYVEIKINEYRKLEQSL